ncbi:TetR/AcrR family transcriptional regulator C-terminal domain-containing protein [Nonomuraea typhae]|uniref:TetR/AcrR family transcriptional regulator C-terminal domain-containing protein n=1 Tax=Nonomuraea typhae TaxID=2603600 RepID=A0ABW7Z467_9ACTN
MSSPAPPYRQIAAEIRAQILTGRLRPGERAPSIREIARRWQVAAATATKALAVLRDDGLVHTKVGAGTVVSAGPRPQPSQGGVPGPPKPAAPRRTAVPRQPLDRSQALRTAIAVADAEGLHALSMRRVAAELGVATMTLYRHVPGKDDLLTQMAEEVFARAPLPARGPHGWRAKLELVARRQWQLCRRHLWLPRAVSFTRPLLVPAMMAHTEWTLRALDGLGLSMTMRTREALALHGLVHSAALSMAAEAEAEAESGVTLERWWLARRLRAENLLRSGRFPLLAAITPAQAGDDDGHFHYALARHLDGLAVLVHAHQQPPDADHTRATGAQKP